MEEFFFSNFTMIEEGFAKEYSKKESLEKESASMQTSVVKSSNHSSIKLPKISLEKFSGDYRKWPTFHDLFRALVHENGSLAPAEKLQYLKLHVSGEPEQLLRHFQVTDGNYQSAWDILKERYDDKRVLVNTELKIMMSQSSVSSESTHGVKGLLDTTTECLQALTNLEIDTSGWDPIIVYLIVQKLPQETHQLWEQHVSKKKTLPSWSELREFLQSRFRTLEAVASKGSFSHKEHKGFSKSQRSPHSFHVSANASCLICLGNHKIRQCPKFLSMDLIQRQEVVKNKGLCFNCLGFGHMLANCPSQQRCVHCKQRHHSQLHRTTTELTNNGVNGDDKHQAQNIPRNSHDWRQANRSNSHNVRTEAHSSSTHDLSATTPAFVPENSSSVSANLNSFVANRTPHEQILLSTALVRIISPEGREQVVRALIDQGSQASFITESVVQNLKLRKKAVSANIHGVGNSQVNHVTHQVNFIIKPLQDDASIEVSGLILRRLTDLLPARTITSHSWKHIEGLSLADPQFYIPGKIDLLLGADIYSYIILNGLIKSSEGGPIAQKTLLGWILSGEVPEVKGNATVDVNNFHVCASLDDQLKLFWELEEISCTKGYTEEEETCEELFAKTCKRLADGRYEVELPFKEETSHSHLGRSRYIALTRLQQLERRFHTNPVLKQDYMNCLKEYMTLGHMERVSSNEEAHVNTVNGMTSYSCSYLPHHGVLKDSSTTTKLRVVFDAARPTQSGICLNDRLMKGPVIQDELASLLIRWRKHRIAFTADIEKMYRQIRVRDQHTEFQRILWRESQEHQIEDYKLLTVTFGTKSAPYLATRVLKQLALDERERYPIGSQVALTDFYVDDLLSGADTIERALETQRELIGLMKTGGFPLRKWTSNCNELLKNLPSEHRETNFPLDIDCQDVRTLGTHWNPQTDTFTHSLNLSKEPAKWTKRTILSEVSKLFDPLGWLAPIKVQAKIFIQKLWLGGMEWDERVPLELEREWMRYREKLQEITTIRIERWLHISETDTVIELHGFADASIKAYAAVVYLCTQTAEGKRHVTLVTSKTKIAPIKTVSLPRLELCGATLLAKLMRYVAQALNLTKPVSLQAWTDSQIVIAWLKAHPIKWTTFVANRVSHIHELLGKNVWAHVPTKDNPADCASRGMYPAELRDHKLWWKGPEWLWKSRTHWPKGDENACTNLEERKKCVHHVNIKDEELVSRYSSLTKLLRITAYCRRFVDNLRSPRDRRKAGYLKAEEIQNALRFWIKNAQNQHFPEEIRALTNNDSIDRKSKLLKMNAFLDETGLIRVGGRLRNAELSYNEQHPIILPDKCHLTKLIVGKTHRDTLHGGAQLMMAVIGKTYWLINARNTVRQHIHSCVPCHRQKAVSQTQLMGDLPAPRVTSSRPFTHTGVDYCGPFEVKTHKGRNPKKYKAYIALFICMAIKAIHLELVTDLSAEGFIAAYRRFCSRRGLCSQLYCDCGTNFVGASRILTRQQKYAIDQLNSEIATALETEGVKFNFIPPASPHFGGLWEAGVRSTKHHLRRVLANTILTYEEFSTVLTQVEACLNSRPLCELSSDPQDLTSLTPAHFLIGDTLLTPPEPSLLEVNINHLDRWQLLQRLYQHFWKRWNTEYLCRLQQRPKWTRKTENMTIGDLVILKDEHLPPSRWILARITETHPGPDGLVRVVTIKTKDTTLKRPITKVCRLPIDRSTNQPTENKQ